MPMYTFCCSRCNITREQKLTFSEYDQVRAGTTTMHCSNCEGPEEIVFNPGSLQFGLKEGSSGGWASKSIKENKYRSKRQVEMARREKDHVHKPQLVPNYQGEEAGNWRDIQDHVRSKHGQAAASTYDRLVQQESSK